MNARPLPRRAVRNIRAARPHAVEAMGRDENEKIQVVLELERDRFPVRGRFSGAGEERPFDGWEELAGLLVAAVGPRPSLVERLTPAQRRVAELALEGLTNAEIAERLIVSPRTVKRHLNDAFKRLGVRSRVELLRRAIEPALRMGLAAHRKRKPAVESSEPGQGK